MYSFSVRNVTKRLILYECDHVKTCFHVMKKVWQVEPSVTLYNFTPKAKYDSHVRNGASFSFIFHSL